MRPKNIRLLFLLIVPAISLNSCEEEMPKIPNPPEVITNFIYILTPENGGDNVVLSYEDLDREGGNPPSYLTEPIPANTVFNGVIQILDKTQSPLLNITSEIAEDDEAHQIFFSSMGVELTVSYEDMDENGNPTGLISKVSSGAAGTGNLKVILKHEPDKFALGVAEGDITNAAGSTDIEANFPIIIE